jgi:hypothetical protein
MMLAVADAAEGNGSMPAELELALQCDKWGALPEEGGMLDQPLGLMRRMNAYLNIYNAFKSEQQRGKMTLSEWSSSYPAAWKILAKVEKMRRG